MRRPSRSSASAGRGWRRPAADLIGNFTGLTVTGLTEALRVIPRSYAMYRRLIAAARERRPDVFVAIDFPDFNFRLMAALHRLGIPIVYYVSPQLWAWRPRRMETMKRFVDKVLVIFPFEARALRARRHSRLSSSDIRSSIWRGPRSRGPRFSPSTVSLPDAPTVALLPGSRPNEIDGLRRHRGGAAADPRARAARAVRRGARAEPAGCLVRAVCESSRARNRRRADR